MIASSFSKYKCPNEYLCLYILSRVISILQQSQWTISLRRVVIRSLLL
jgi:hypothetical protein